MRRRSKATGGPAKTRRSKTVTLKRGNAPKAVRRRSPSAAGQETEVAKLARERDEAVERLFAASEVLRVISSSPGRTGAGVQSHTGKCDAPLRGNLWHHVSLRWRGLPHCGDPRAVAVGLQGAMA